MQRAWTNECDRQTCDKDSHDLMFSRHIDILDEEHDGHDAAIEEEKDAKDDV